MRSPPKLVVTVMIEGPAGVPVVMVVPLVGDVGVGELDALEPPPQLTSATQLARTSARNRTAGQGGRRLFEAEN